MARTADTAATVRATPQAARTAAWLAWRGLVEVLAGRDAEPGWTWRSQQERQAGQAALGGATLALCILSVASMHARGLHIGGQPLSLWRDAVAVAAIAPAPLAVRYPLLAWRVGWVALLLVPLVPAIWWGGWPWGPPQIFALLVAFCLAGARHQRSVVWWLWALTLVPWWIWLQADVSNLDGPYAATAVFAAVTIAVDSVGSRLRAQQALAAETERTEVERARRAVLEERTRIARELHDVVAHHMSLIAVQAETAPYRLGDLPESAQNEFGSLSAVAREALTDMRRLLGVLRQDQAAGLAPQPHVRDLPMLVDAARRAGVPVKLVAPAVLDAVPAGIGLCAYRIVQESLSNASQHAPGAAVTVSLNQDGGAMVLEVANGPGTLTHEAANQGHSGHGLIGMRERVALLGGSLSVGPAPDGGFVVSAVLPLSETA